jgi:hypothetical protein
MVRSEPRGAHMRRREFITLVGGVATWPLAVSAQQPQRMRRIGVLMDFPADDPEATARIAAFLQGLQKWGWTDGGNVRIDYRSASDGDRIRRYAAEMVALAPDVILTVPAQPRRLRIGSSLPRLNHSRLSWRACGTSAWVISRHFAV